MNWKPWLHGLGAAFIGGGSSAATAGIMNAGDHPLALLKKMGTAFLISGVITTLYFLKASPLPDSQVSTFEQHSVSPSVDGGSVKTDVVSKVTVIPAPPPTV